MNKQLYEAVADKTLSFGCIYNLKYTWNWEDYYHIRKDDYKQVTSQSEILTIKASNLEILWHPIHIGHCLSWIEENPQWYEADFKLLHLYKNKRENIEHPDNLEAKEYMITLIQWWDD